MSPQSSLTIILFSRQPSCDQLGVLSWQKRGMYIQGMMASLWSAKSGIKPSPLLYPPCWDWEGYSSRRVTFARHFHFSLLRFSSSFLTVFGCVRNVCQFVACDALHWKQRLSNVWFVYFKRLKKQNFYRCLHKSLPLKKRWKLLHALNCCWKCGVLWLRGKNVGKVVNRDRSSTPLCIIHELFNVVHKIHSFACCAFWRDFYLSSFCVPESFDFILDTMK